MAVPAQTPILVSEANGATTVFPYNFLIFDDADLLVSGDEVPYVLGVDYTVDGVGVASGGNVTFFVPPAAGIAIARKRNMEYKRDDDFQTGGDMIASEVNRNYDNAVMMIQQLGEEQGRTLKLPPSLSGGSTALVPEALKGIRWNSTATGFENYEITSFLAPGGSDLVGFIQGGTGAVAGTAQNKMRERITLADFGADPTGAADATAAMNAAYARAKALKRDLHLGPGTFKISSTLTWDGDVSVIGDGGTSNYGCTLLSWAGSAGGKMVDVTGRHYGLRFERIALEGNSVAGTGIQFDRLQNSQINILAVYRTTVDAILIKPNPAFSTDNFMFNEIGTIYTDTAAGNGLRIDTFNGALGNTCHNVFRGISPGIRNGVAKKALVVGDSDNNSFLMTYSAVQLSDGNSYGMELLAAARSNYFYHFQGSVIARNGSKNAIFGFDRENGQPAPTVEATAQLFWTEVGNNAVLWNMTHPLRSLQTYLEGNLVTSGGGPGPSYTDIAHPASGGRLRIGYSVVGVNNVGASMRIYSSKDGGGFAIPAMMFENDGLVQFRVGGKTHTYAAAAPGAGTWAQGDIAYNTAPTAGGNAGWICVAGGTPGTWKTFGAIAA